MDHYVAGIFDDSQSAGKAVAQLKHVGFTDNISILAKGQENAEVKTHTIKQDNSTTTGGAVIGGVLGLLAGSAVIIPGLGALLVAGPIAALIAAAGALAGGLVGFLIDHGIPEEQARDLEAAVRKGETLVLVETDATHEAEVRQILSQKEAKQIDSSTPSHFMSI